MRSVRHDATPAIAAADAFRSAGEEPDGAWAKFVAASASVVGAGVEIKNTPRRHRGVADRRPRRSQLGELLLRLSR